MMFSKFSYKSPRIGRSILEELEAKAAKLRVDYGDNASLAQLCDKIGQEELSTATLAQHLVTAQSAAAREYYLTYKSLESAADLVIRYQHSGVGQGLAACVRNGLSGALWPIALTQVKLTLSLEAKRWLTNRTHDSLGWPTQLPA